jgi:hypothetical protein
VRHPTFIGASLAQLADDLLSRVTRPARSSVEGNDAHKVGVLTLKQVLDESGAPGMAGKIARAAVCISGGL